MEAIKGDGVANSSTGEYIVQKILEAELQGRVSVMSEATESEIDYLEVQIERGRKAEALKGVSKGQIYVKKGKKKKLFGSKYQDASAESVGMQMDKFGEEQLLEYYKRKAEEKAILSEEERRQMERLLEINSQLRQYDFRAMRREELTELRTLLDSLHRLSASSSASIEDILAFLNQIKLDHDDQISLYNLSADYLSSNSFAYKI